MAGMQIIDEQCVDRESRPQDQHVMPDYGREHDSYPTCWCKPSANYEDPDNGGRVWLHRDMS